MKNLVKIDRLSAWILLLGMVLYFISGFGITKGIISQEFASKLHLNWLTIIILVAFTIHGAFATRLALIRWRLWDTPLKFIWGLFFVLFLSSFIYIDRFYQPKMSSEESGASVSSTATGADESDQLSKEASQESSSSTQSAGTSSSSTTTASKTFTKETLAKYDGSNGNPAYVAVDGKVYDLSSVFKQGKHFSHYAGTELTNAFYSYHASRALSKYPVVGSYVTSN